MALSRLSDLRKKFSERFAAGLKKLKNRLNLWGNNLEKTENFGRIDKVPITPEEVTNYVWRIGATEKHCDTCLAMNGVVATQAQVQSYRRDGIYPKSGDLSCGGWHCDCNWFETSAPPTNPELTQKKLEATVESERRLRRIRRGAQNRIRA